MFVSRTNDIMQNILPMSGGKVKTKGDIPALERTADESDDIMQKKPSRKVVPAAPMTRNDGKSQNNPSESFWESISAERDTYGKQEKLSL